MTSAPVMSSVEGLMANTLNTTTSTGKTTQADFKSFLSNSEGQASDTSFDNQQKLAVKSEVKTEKQEAVEEEPKVEPRENVTSKTDVKEIEKEATDEDTDVLKNAVDEAVKAISEELDVSLEDIENALENLGFTMMALLDTTKLPEIVAVLTDSEDVLSLTTDENLYESLTRITKEVESLVKEVETELNLETSDFSEVIKEFSLEENIKDKEPVKAFENETFTQAAKTEQEETVAVSFDKKITVTKTESTENKPSIEENPIEKVESQDSKELFEKNDSDFRNSTFSFAENLVQKTLEALNEAAEVETFTTVDVENVLNQLTEGININLTPETSEINLRLHPESLGTVSVKVTSNNEGVLTAQFTAQNESVKAIIESQALVLKETLESKGVTIEAVEVMVESHEFERNLSDQNKGNQNSNEPKKRGIRRIDLSNSLEEEAEEDSLVKEIMAMNGNSVDYIA